MQDIQAHSNHDNGVNSPDSKHRILAFLHTQKIGVLSANEAGHAPHASVVYFATEDNFMITFTTKKETKKHELLAKDPKVSLVIFEPYSQTTCQITGTVTPISDETQITESFKNTLKASLQTSDSGIPPVSKLFAGNYVAYALKPNYIQLMAYNRPDKGDHSMFDTLEFDT